VRLRVRIFIQVVVLLFLMAMPILAFSGIAVAGWMIVFDMREDRSGMLQASFAATLAIAAMASGFSRSVAADAVAPKRDFFTGSVLCYCASVGLLCAIVFRYAAFVNEAHEPADVVLRWILRAGTHGPLFFVFYAALLSALMGIGFISFAIVHLLVPFPPERDE
jgi:hypothetical protein